MNGPEAVTTSASAMGWHGGFAVSRIIPCVLSQAVMVLAFSRHLITAGVQASEGGPPSLNPIPIGARRLIVAPN